MVEPLPPESLRRVTDPARLPFQSTADVAEQPPFLGQERAVEAVRFALDVHHKGYNLFVLGAPGSGRHHLVTRLLAERAAGEPAAPDWIYLHRFDDPTHPRAVALPAGEGPELRDGLARAVEDLPAALAQTFESDAFRARREELEKAAAQEREDALEALGEKAQESGLMLVSTPAGLVLVPAKGDEALSPKEVEALPPEEREHIEASMKALHEEVHRLLEGQPRRERAHREKLRELERATAATTVQVHFEAVRERWREREVVAAHLVALEADVLDHIDRFRGDSEDSPAAMLRKAVAGGGSDESWERRYQVNLVVDHSGDAHAPVVYEDNPTLPGLCGRVEHHSKLGTLVTDFTLIRSGALHRANGGYLVLDARKVLLQPFAWHSLVRALRAGEVRIESLGQALSLVSTASLEPDPIPLELKVVLVGEPLIYYLLQAADPDFDGLFKVPAEMDDRADRGDGGEAAYAELVACLAKSEGVRPLSREAVAAVIDHAARLAGDAERLSTNLQNLSDLLCEADHFAGDRETVGSEEVRQAIEALRRRAGRLRDRLLEQTVRGALRIETGGAAVGQVNGLMVLQVGRVPFGAPVRITARVRLGKGNVVDVQREVSLSGPTHSKGVLILGGFVASRYAPDRPLPLAAQLVFEQTYGPVEGDSASLAEACALLSAISELPLSQEIAVTGSIDQHGHVQAIGGVNEKIEGFFDLCAARGLSGRQGVLVPAANEVNLMLRGDVVEAAAAGRFHVWSVDTIDAAIERLTGRPAREVDARVEARIEALIAAARRYAERSDGEGEQPELPLRPAGS